MKELTKKILEAGLVDKHTTRAMEKWGQLEEGSVALVGKKKVTETTLAEFVEDIETLLDQDLEIRETRFEVSVDGPYTLKIGSYEAQCFRDQFGRYLVNNPNIDPFIRGDLIEINGRKMTLLDVELLFKEYTASAVQLVVDEGEQTSN
jgi:hypothetical protein